MHTIRHTQREKIYINVVQIILMWPGAMKKVFFGLIENLEQISNVSGGKKRECLDATTFYDHSRKYVHNFFCFIIAAVAGDACVTCCTPDL